MRLEVVCAMLAIAVVTIGTSAEDSGRPWRNYVDDDEDGRSVRDALDGGRPWRNYVDADEDGRSVRDALDGGRPWRNYVDDERSVRDAHDDDDGRSIRVDRRRCVACDLCRRTYGSGSIRCQVLCRQLGC